MTGASQAMKGKQRKIIQNDYNQWLFLVPLKGGIGDPDTNKNPEKDYQNVLIEPQKKNPAGDEIHESSMDPGCLRFRDP